MDDTIRHVISEAVKSMTVNKRDDISFRFVGEHDAAKIVSGAKRRTDNKRFDKKQFEKYFEDRKKRWFGCFDGSGNCVSLAVVKNTPQEDGIRDIILLAEIQAIMKGFGKHLILELLRRYPNIWWAADPNGGKTLADYYRQFKGEGVSEFNVEVSTWTGGRQTFFYRAEDARHRKTILKALGGFERKDDGKKLISFPEHECGRLSRKRIGDVFYTTRVSDDYAKYNDDDMLSLDFGKHNEKGKKHKTGRITKVWDLKDVKDHPFYEELTKDERKFLSKYKRIKVLQITVL